MHKSVSAIPLTAQAPPLDVGPSQKNLDQMNRLCRSSAVWLFGPLGSGKAQLLRAHIERCKRPYLWYALSPEDTDPMVFFPRLTSRAKRILSLRSGKLPSFSSKDEERASQFSRRYFDKFFAQMPEPAFLVFHDCNLLPQDSPFYRSIRHALRRLRPHHQVYFTSISPPPWRMLDINSRKSLTVLKWHSPFLSDESPQMSNESLAPKLRTETYLPSNPISDLSRVRLILAVLEAGNENENLSYSAAEYKEHPGYHIAARILHKLETGVKTFLLKTALFPSMTPQMAKQLTGRGSVNQFFDGMQPPREKDDTENETRKVFCYHPLLREFLLRQAKAFFKPDEWKALRQLAAQILENHKQIEEALEILDYSIDREIIISLIKKHAGTLCKKGDILESCVARLPETTVAKDPWLHFWRGICNVASDPIESRKILQEAYDKFQQQEDQLGMLHTAAAVLDSIWYDFNAVSFLGPWLDRLETLIRESSGFSSPAIEARITISRFMAHALFSKSAEQRSAALERAMPFIEGLTDIDDRIQAIFILAWLQMVRGETEGVALSLDTMQKIAVEPRAMPLSRLRLGLIQAMYYQITGDHKRCSETVAKCLAFSRKSGIRLLDGVLTAQAIANDIAANNLKSAEAALEQMAGSINFDMPLNAFYYYSLRAEMDLIAGKAPRARVNSELAIKLALDLGLPFLIGCQHLVHSHILRAIGEMKSADQSIQTAEEIARKYDSHYLRCGVLLAYAHSALLQGNTAKSHPSLSKGLKIARVKSFFNGVLTPPDTLEELCIHALEAKIEVPFVQKLIRNRRLVPRVPPIHLESWPYELKIYTLGRFSVARHGAPLLFPKKAQRKPLLMLQILIAAGGRQVREELISDTMWPDAEGDVAHTSFGTTLYRLRRLLRNPKAIILRDGCLSIDPRYCWVDIWAFERILGQADKIHNRQELAEGQKEVTRLAQQASDIYKGPFLGQEIWEPWAYRCGERLKSKYLRAVGIVGHYWESQGDYKKATECLEHTLEVDNRDEESYRRLMACYHRLGNRVKALATYQRCKRMLSIYFGIKPSKETQIMKNTIMNGSHPPQ